MSMTVREANAIYDLLVRLAGASNRELHRTMFIDSVVLRGTNEYRFCGALGFGGKFYASNWRVSAYPEDVAANSDLELIVNHTNNALYELKAFFSALNSRETTTAV